MKHKNTLLIEYLNFLKGLGYSKGTIYYHEEGLKRYFKDVKKDLRDVKSKDIKEYVETLKKTKTKYNKPFSEGTISNILSSIKGFFNYLFRNEYILLNPVEDLEIKLNTKNARGVFSKEEMNTFLDCIELKGKHGQRDRAIFELIYSTGLRASEVINLTLTEVDLRERVLFVKNGKGAKDRYDPFNETALSFLKLYINNERKKIERYVKGEDKKILFLSIYGKLAKNKIGKLFNKYLLKSGVEKKNRTLHSIRHSTATHLLKAGADVRYVAELLGHESIQTTVRYTHLLTDNIKKAYKSAHPRENQFYEEITGEYLKEIESLENELKQEKKYKELTGR